MGIISYASVATKVSFIMDVHSGKVEIDFPLLSNYDAVVPLDILKKI